jgi:iron complex outermembrane receptor protein
LLQVSTIPGFFGTTVNADKTIHSGLEFGMTARLPANLEWRQNLLINNFKLDDDAAFGNNRLPGIPRSLLRGELLYRNSGFYIGPTIEVSPQRYAVDFAETLYADSYTLLGLKMGQQYNDHWSWFLEGRNLTDKKYAASTGITRTATPNQDIFLPGEGRTVYMGLQWRY